MIGLIFTICFLSVIVGGVLGFVTVDLDSWWQWISLGLVIVPPAIGLWIIYGILGGY